MTGALIKVNEHLYVNTTHVFCIFVKKMTEEVFLICIDLIHNLEENNNLPKCIAQISSEEKAITLLLYIKSILNTSCNGCYWIQGAGLEIYNTHYIDHIKIFMNRYPNHETFSVKVKIKNKYHLINTFPVFEEAKELVDSIVADIQVGGTCDLTCKLF